MTALPGWPAVSGAATFQHIRRALAGQVVRDAAGSLRKGILPHSTSALVTGTATMNVAVGPFVAVLDRNGAIFLANDGSLNLLLSSAPASGSRWSIVYVKQRESEAPFSDGADGPIIDRVESTTSESSARALLPAGALELAVVKVDAGSANTNAVGVTITQTAPFTAMTGGVVLLRNATERAAWSPADSTLAYQMDDDALYERIDGVWKLIGGTGGWSNLTLTAGWSTVANYGVPQFRTINGRTELRGTARYNATIPTTTTLLATGAPAPAAPDSNATWLISTSNAQTILFLNPRTDGGIRILANVTGGAGTDYAHLDGLSY